MRDRNPHTNPKVIFGLARQALRCHKRFRDNVDIAFAIEQLFDAEADESLIRLFISYYNKILQRYRKNEVVEICNFNNYETIFKWTNGFRSIDLVSYDKKDRVASMCTEVLNERVFRKLRSIKWYD